MDVEKKGWNSVMVSPRGDTNIFEGDNLDDLDLGDFMFSVGRQSHQNSRQVPMDDLCDYMTTRRDQPRA
jgi:hypothetical protein